MVVSWFFEIKPQIKSHDNSNSPKQTVDIIIIINCRYYPNQIKIFGQKKGLKKLIIVDHDDDADDHQHYHHDHFLYIWHRNVKNNNVKYAIILVLRFKLNLDLETKKKFPKEKTKTERKKVNKILIVTKTGCNGNVEKKIDRMFFE